MKKIKIIVFAFITMFSFNIVVNAQEPSLYYQTHVQNIGWQDFVVNGNKSGTEGQSLRLEGIKVIIDGHGQDLHIAYQTHVQNIGWQDWVYDGTIAGTTGQSLRLEAIKIKLTGASASNYDIYYQTHVQNIGWLGWAKNGEESGSAGYSYRLESIIIKIVPKDSEAPGTNYRHFVSHDPDLYYKTHVQNIGWQNYMNQPDMAGTEGQSLRLEGFQAFVDGHGKDLHIEYQTHVQNIGWQDWVKDNDVAGTTGQSLRLEAIKIKLTGIHADNYDIYYQVHVQNVGWLDWAKNGEEAGSAGYSYRLEAIRIVIVKKGEDAPGSTMTPYILKSNFLWIGSGSNKKLYNVNSGLLGTNVKRIIDVSEHQGKIDWDTAISVNEIDGVILRAGYGSFYEDGQLAYNVEALKRLNVPYGIYIFSYAENDSEATNEANGILNVINKYSLNPTLGVYYDLEDWKLLTSNSGSITMEQYESMSNIFLTAIKDRGFNAGIYTGLNFAKNRFNEATKNNISWIAQYNSTLQYTGSYKIWQYSDTERIEGIKGNVDMNVLFNS